MPMKKLLLLLIIPFLSFGQCEDESACNYGMTAEDFIAGAFTGECEYVGDYCFLNTSFSMLGEINGSTSYFYVWNMDCECVEMEQCDGAPTNGCFMMNSQDLLPLPIPDSLKNNNFPVGIIGSSCFSFSPGDSCLYYSSPVASLLPISLLDYSFVNYPFDWLIVNHFNSVFNDECECECVPGEYFYYFLNIIDGSFNIESGYDDCVGGFVVNTGVDELEKHKSLITKVDILGRETTNNKGFQLHIYNDGSVEKKYVIK